MFSHPDMELPFFVWNFLWGGLASVRGVSSCRLFFLPGLVHWAPLIPKNGCGSKAWGPCLTTMNGDWGGEQGQPGR